MINRRLVLKSALGGLAGLSLAPYALAASDSKKAAGKEKPSVTALTDKLSLISGVGGNVVALSTDDGMLLVDTGGPEYSRAVMSQLRELPGGRKVHTVFNTHWHSDQTGSNELFGKAGAKIVAHEKTKLWLATDHWVPGEERYEKARPKHAIPTETFYTTGKTTAGAEQIEYGYLLEAHTDGDIYVYFRNSNVLVIGDVISPVSDPEFDWFGGGWVGGRLDSQDLLLKLCNDQTRIVAGTGPVLTRAQLQADREMMQKIYDRMVDMMRKGMTWKDILAAGALEGLGRTWADPEKFMYAVHKGFWAHHNTLSHDVV
jgi:cyclase